MRATRKCAAGQIWLAGQGLRTADLIYQVALRWEKRAERVQRANAVCGKCRRISLWIILSGRALLALDGMDVWWMNCTKMGGVVGDTRSNRSF